MSHNNQTGNYNEWIEDAISKKYIKLYEHKYFSNIQEIGSGNSGKVYRANWRNSGQYFALKSFNKLDNITIKKLVHELGLQQEVAFHSNIISYYGITQEISNDQIINYLLVMEYADGGSLQNYLKRNFSKLTWNDKYDLAYQLTCAVLCLHNEEIVHRDLHSGSVLVHQNTIKVSDFGLSKGIKEISNPQSRLVGVIPYFEPKGFVEEQSYLLNKKSDVYSIGVLLWEISSGKPPFEGKQYDRELAKRITQGLRETIVPNTPPNYSKLYVECWDGEPDNRPNMNDVFNRLKPIIDMTHTNNNNYEPVPFHVSINNSLNGGELSHDFNEEITEILISSGRNTNILPEKEDPNVVNKLIEFVFMITEKKETTTIGQNIIDYFNKNEIDSLKIYKQLLDNQNDLDFIFLLGYFYYVGIETSKNYERAFRLFKCASNISNNNASGQKKSYILANYYVGICYHKGYGTAKNEKLAIGYFNEVANKDFAAGQLNIGYCYCMGIGVDKDLKLAARWYQKAADKENLLATYNLGLLYLNGDGVDKNHSRAFKLFEKSAEECLDGIVMLGRCYESGIGTKINKRKAFGLYQKTAELGDSQAQYNLAFMYKNGYGTAKDYDKAAYWYKKSADQGHKEAYYKLCQLSKTRHDDDCKII